jgi:hypothetical protein
MNIKEYEINWNKLFLDLMERDEELFRAYWFRPAKILDTNYKEDNVRKYYAKKTYDKYLRDLNDSELERINEEASRTLGWLEEVRNSFNSVASNYDYLSNTYDNIAIEKVGYLTVNPYKQEYGSEKGVDIALAVKMLSLSYEKKCDKIILVSGDYDYAEAIKKAKENIHLHIVKLNKGYLLNTRNISEELQQLADKLINVYEEDLKTKYSSNSSLQN